MKRGLMSVGVLVLILIGALLVGRFWMDNSELIRLRFLSWRTQEISLGALSLLSFGSGVLVTAALLTSGMFSKHFEARRLRRENSALQTLLERSDRSQASENSDSSTPAHQK